MKPTPEPGFNHRASLNEQPRSKVVQGLFWAYVVFMLVITLLIFPSANPPVNLVPFRSIIHDCTVGGFHAFIVNFVGNVVAFIPFGVLYPLNLARTRRWGEAVLFCACFSLTIEFLQFASRCRVADVDDVLLNTLGGAIGVWMRWAWLRLRAQRSLRLQLSDND